MTIWKNFLAGAAFMALASPFAVTAQQQTANAPELSGTALLNKQQAEKSAQEAAAFNARVVAAEQSEASSEALFQARTQSYEAEKQLVADHAADERIQWEADVKACEAGDKSRCAKPARERSGETGPR